MTIRTTEAVGRAVLEHTLALRNPGLSAVVVPAPRAPLTVLPAAVREEVVSLWHRPDDRSFAGIGKIPSLSELTKSSGRGQMSAAIVVQFQR